MSHNMEAYLEKTVEKYLDLAGPSFLLKRAAAPFLDVGDSRGDFAPAAEGNWTECPWCQGRFSDEHFAKGKGSVALRATASAKPLLDAHVLVVQEESKCKSKGELATIAMKVLMSILYAVAAWTA